MRIYVRPEAADGPCWYADSLELASGWHLAVMAESTERRMELVVQYDPKNTIPTFGVKVIGLRVEEARRLRDGLTAALEHASGGRADG